MTTLNTHTDNEQSSKRRRSKIRGSMSAKVVHLYRGYPIISANRAAICGREFVRFSILPRETTCKRCRQLDPYCRYKDLAADQEEKE